MKKIVFSFLLVFMMLFVSACGGGESDERTLQNFIDAYIEAGVEVDPAEKPMFGMIGATDGVIFYLDNKKVAIYEYASSSELNKNKGNFTQMSDWPVNGKFTLETKNEQAIEIFNSVN